MREKLLTANLYKRTAVSSFFMSSAEAIKPDRKIRFSILQSGNLCVDFLGDHVFWHSPDHLVDDFTILENQHGRNASDTILCCGIRIFVNIELGYNSLALKLTCKFFDHRAEHLARATPSSPEINKGYLVRVKNLGFKILVRSSQILSTHCIYVLRVIVENSDFMTIQLNSDESNKKYLLKLPGNLNIIRTENIFKFTERFFIGIDRTSPCKYM